jgi:large subunit ribosomal protein L21
MYAVVNISGKQFKVSKDDEIFAPLQSGDAGDKVEFDEVLLLEDKGKVQSKI